MPNKHSKKVLNATGPATYYRRIQSIQPDYLIGYWPMNDAAGRTCTDLTGTTTAVELIGNGGFETAGGGGADIWALTWETAGTGALADETTLVHGGGHAAKLTAGSSANTCIKLENSGGIGSGLINVIPGLSCTLTFWTRGDGTYAGRYSIYDNTNSTFIRTVVTTGVAGTTYAQVSYSFTVPAACYAIQVTLWCPSTNTGISYFDDVSMIVNYPMHGVYQPSGITYGQTGVGDGLTATVHNGTDSGVLIGSLAFGSLWNGNVGSMIAWGKIDASGTWTDGSTFRYPGVHIKSRQNSTVYLVMGKSTTNHTLAWRRRVINAQFENTYTFGTVGTLLWFCMGMTWDVTTANKIRCYLYVPGEVAWSKLYDATPATGMESWSNASYTADDSNTVIAAGSLTQQEWKGSSAHHAIWAGKVLTDAEMYRAMVPHRGV